MINVGWSTFATAIFAIAILVLALRLVFDADRGRKPRKVRIDGRFGLLQRAALVPDTATGEAIRRDLQSSGVRATLAEREDGDVEVLVFADDIPRARIAVREFAERTPRR